MSDPQEPRQPPNEDPDRTVRTAVTPSAPKMASEPEVPDAERTVKMSTGSLATRGGTKVPPPFEKRGEPEETAVTAIRGEGVSGSNPGSNTGQLKTLGEGSVVADRYRILSILGVGGMGVVYRAHDEALGIEIALKVLRPEVAHDDEFLSRFRNEVLIARQVTHRNVVRLHDLGESGGLYYLSMDLVTGKSLQDLLKEESRLDPVEAVRILLQIGRALAEAHRQGVVHRDLKPANILLASKDGEAYISDFGIARSLASPSLTATGMVIGTPHYLSPEQAQGQDITAASDIYALGIIFVEMLSGKLPFSGGTLLEILSQRITGHHQSLDELGVKVDPAIAAVVDRCLASSPQDRYPSAAELVHDLEDLERPLARRRKESRDRIGQKLVKVVGAVAVLAAAGWGAVQMLDREPATEPPAPGPPPPVVEAPAPKPPPVVTHALAVLPFDATGSDELDWASTGVAEMLTASLAESESLRVIESLRVVQTMQDLGFAAGTLRDDHLRQLAEVFDVDRIVAGSLRAAGDSVQLEARIVEVDRPGAAPRTLEPLQGRTEEIFDLVAGLSSGLREALEIEARDVETPSLTASPAAMAAYSEGLQLLSQGQTLDATPALQRAIAEDPDFTAAWSRLAEAYDELGQVDDALEAASEAVRSAGANSGRLGYEARAREALLRGEHDTAQQLLEELVERYPADTEAQVALAEAYGQTGRFADAVERLEDVVEIDASQPRIWYLLGRYSIQAGDPQKAVDEYLMQALVRQRTAKNEQGQAEVLNAFGVGYMNLGQLEDAADSYGKAAEIRERIGDRRGLATCHLNLSLIALTRGDNEAAEGHLESALAIHEELGNRPGIAETLNGLGQLEERRGRHRAALDRYREALQISKELGDEWMLAESHSNVGYGHYLLSEYDSAVLYLEKALEIYRRNEAPQGIVLSLQSLGFCQLAQGDWTEASRSFLEALQLAREIGLPTPMAVSHGNLGALAQNEGRYRAAVESFDEALTILREVGEVLGQVEFLLRKAELYIDLGAGAEAAGELARIEILQEENVNPEDQAGLLRLQGRWHLLRGQREEAAAKFAEALSAAESSGVVPVLIEARIDAGGMAEGDENALADLREAAAEAKRLGHALLTFRSAEALGRAELAAGNAEEAEAVLKEAVRLAERREVNGYAGTYRLRSLLAEALRIRGDDAAADRTLKKAGEDLERVLAEVPTELRASFEALPDVAALEEEPDPALAPNP